MCSWVDCFGSGSFACLRSFACSCRLCTVILIGRDSRSYSYRAAGSDSEDPSPSTPKVHVFVRHPSASKRECVSTPFASTTRVAASVRGSNSERTVLPRASVAVVAK